MTSSAQSLDTASLAESIVARFDASDAVCLDAVPAFKGGGLYALYYRGPFDTYRVLSSVNETALTHPIFVGTAEPRCDRYEASRQLGQVNSRALSGRLRRHATSIRAVSNLDIAHFQARWLVVDSVWTALGESAMIRRYRPVWNAVLVGFDDTDPGRRRAEGLRSAWDTLHPGRPWAAKYIGRDETADQIAQDVGQYIRERIG